MSALDDDLFFACLRYCESVYHYMNEREKHRWSLRFRGAEQDKIMELEEKRVRHYFQKLKDIIEEIDGENNERPNY